jgi:hypothetical protein
MDDLSFKSINVSLLYKGNIGKGYSEVQNIQQFEKFGIYAMGHLL